MEGPTLWERLRRGNPYVWDALLSIAVFLVSVLAGSSFFSSPDGFEIRFFGGRHGSTDFFFSESGVEVFHLRTGLPAMLLIAAACAPLVWRRRMPTVALSLTAIAAGAYQFLGYREGLVSFALMVAAYTAAAHRDRRAVLMFALPITLAAVLTILLIDEAERGLLETIAILTLVALMPLLFGRIAYNRRRRIQRDMERASRDAVTEERTRIARELHDAVAHSMGVMVVQAGAARTVLEKDQESAATALQRIEETGRTGLTEMRRLVGILETGDQAAELVPQPGLDQLDELLETVRQTGLPVELNVEGTPHELPPGVDLTAYRIVQEALTNVLRHADASQARVELRYRSDAVEVEVSDDGRGPPPDGIPPGGHGIVGMRERVALFGGSLETGSDPRGGFSVRARIPLASP